MMDAGITIWMPALNEAKRIEKTLTEVYILAKQMLPEFEILVIDDGSTDDTYNVVSLLAARLGSEIKIIKKEKNEGLGEAFKTAVSLAAFPKVTWFPADNAYLIEGIKNLFTVRNDAAVILGYRENLSMRPPIRRFLSGMVTRYVRFLIGKKITDAQGALVLPVDLCRKITFQFARYNFQMQVLTFILSREIQYKEIPVLYSSEADAHSGMLKKKVLWDVIKSAVPLAFLKITGRLGK